MYYLSMNTDTGLENNVKNAPATAKRFNKGDAVTYITSWDGNGTFTFEHWTVYSSGKQQMVLVGEDGFAKHRVLAQDERLVARFATDTETVAYGTARAAKFLANRTAKLNALIDREVALGEGGTHGFVAHLRSNISAFHAPECVSLKTAKDRI